MAEHPMIAEATRRAEGLQRGHAEYTGGAKFFHHMGHKREAAYPWLSDVEIAGEVRMLTRNDIAHEAIVCAARDRILHLSEEAERLRQSLQQIADAHLPDQPASSGDDERTYALRHISKLRGVATAALKA